MTDDDSEDRVLAEIRAYQRGRLIRSTPVRRAMTETAFPNLAGTANSEAARAELVAAGIPTATINPYGECKVDVAGVLHGWVFDRRWYYWSARAEPGHDIDSADLVDFDDEHGAQVRAHGFAGGGALNMGPSVRTFHIDTADGLRAFAAFLNSRARTP